MDSKDFERSILPERRREVTDMMLTVAMGWIAANAIPEQTFPASKLDAWALRNGYEKKDSTALIALLRQVEPLLDHPSDIATAVNDAIMDRDQA